MGIRPKTFPFCIVAGQSGRLVCGYVYADAGEGESTTDLVFAGHNIIAENGTVLAETRFYTGLTISELDVAKLTFGAEGGAAAHRSSQISTPTARPGTLPQLNTVSTSRLVSCPQGRGDREERCEEVFTIAALGLKKRLEHTNASCAVVGLSGGLSRISLRTAAS